MGFVYNCLQLQYCLQYTCQKQFLTHKTLASSVDIFNQDIVYET